ncbi:MAG: secF [Bacillota bacterium]|nr:secF [Bacillota bacterium]
MKKVLAVLLTILIIFGWYVTIFGIGSFAPIKDQIKLGLDLSGGVYVVMEAQTDATGDDLKKLMSQTQAVIERRVNQLGLSEPVVTIEGNNRIRVELPGAEDADEAINAIGKTAQLQFVMSDKTVVLDGSQVKDAGIMTDQDNGGYAIRLAFNKEGSDAFKDATTKIINHQVTSQIDGVPDGAIMIILDGEVISSPVVQSIIPNGEATITAGGTGGFGEEEATSLSALIRGGALPVALKEVQTSVVGPTLGLDALQMSLIAGAIGVALIFILMLVMYRIMGLTANLALLLYILIVFWMIVAMRGVLTLPGIAGLILSVGMAVDANVIIFSRIKEEITNGKTIRVAVSSGFKRAMSTIIDSQITTIIAGIVLYQLGSGSVKGFAMTLMIGIIASIFTAVVVTQLYMELIAENKNLATMRNFGVSENEKKPFAEVSFMKHKKIFYIISVAIIVIGIGAGMIRGFNYGIDFTGGTMFQINIGSEVKMDDLRDVLKESGIDDAEIVHAGKENNEVIIKTVQALDSDAREVVLNNLFDKFDLTEDSVLSVEQFGPSVGDMLKANAVKAVIIASIGMLIYIIIRFEWKFGLAAITSVVHDVLILVAFYGLFNITVNNPFIAAVLTLVGYSINDTIVVFDRIRENLGIMKKNKLDDLIDTSIKQTLVRSLMTSLTTVLAIIPLYILGGETIRQFTLPLIVGIIAGAASSIFIASPVYYDLCQITGGPKYRAKKSKSKD